MTLPKPLITRIEADAKVYSERQNAEIEDKKYIHKKTLMFYAYQAGAKKEMEMAEPAFDALLQIVNSPTPFNELEMVSWIQMARQLASDALAKYKEVTSG